MKNRDFDKWLSTMNDSIATWKYYTDFEKVYKNAEKIKTETPISFTVQYENKNRNIYIKQFNK
ncbi:DpnII family type II restriction endonuclease [Megamonas funiformis]|uniref:DpnII family type II restriction endonuclease n=1 Tax=Megamonas funiformis TaxID=437897 RepID=UPI002666B39D|nr:DpnII family type II restriction endonuclease [Megamonas funiformis]